jgi:hypothetical protein
MHGVTSLELVDLLPDRCAGDMCDCAEQTGFWRHHTSAGTHACADALLCALRASPLQATGGGAVRQLPGVDVHLRPVSHPGHCSAVPAAAAGAHLCHALHQRGRVLGHWTHDR